MLRYVLNILIAIDQLINTLVGGYPDETLSASAYLGEREGKIYGRIFRPVIDFLFWPLQRDHCRRAFEAEFNFSQRPRPW